MVDKEQLKSIRTLLIRNSCPHCRLYLEFIDRINQNLPIEKRIKVIDCINYDMYGIIEDPLIRLLKKYFNSYPVLFLDGQKIEGSNTRIELEAWIKSRLNKDFIFPYENTIQTEKGEIDLRFEKECEFKKSLFGRRVVCKGSLLTYRLVAG